MSSHAAGVRIPTQFTRSARTSLWCLAATFSSLVTLYLVDALRTWAFVTLAVLEASMGAVTLYVGREDIRP